MNDDVKAAVEKLREAFEFDRKRCGNDTAESLWRDELLILAHIDGEPARIASACEEVREAVARHVMGPALKRDPDLFADHLEEVYAATIRRMPLTATPLADEIAALRARVAALERERDMLQTALRDNSAAHSETGKALLRAEAQVEAARAECGRIIDGMYSADSRYVAADVLRAMDGAKP